MFTSGQLREKEIERETQREERERMEKNGNGGGAGCQVHCIWSPSPGVHKFSMGLGPVSVSGGPPELEWLSGVGHDPGGRVPWKERRERKRKRRKNRRRGRVRCCLTHSDCLGGRGCLWLLS